VGHALNHRSHRADSTRLIVGFVDPSCDASVDRLRHIG
jgi:hypothetical protein